MISDGLAFTCGDHQDNNAGFICGLNALKVHI
ncbi:Uncharacterised protein [Serratia ficaria]|nr:Uncharacterised protein [Serratia ficaria]CAI1008366.1 Uncharacterised protein [Serratia ficaria]CAI1679901.1 Uncharacterised protein [Serratia ficaria]CAI2412382.1 Uncharacterised protein [Serratia ficaria]CAI2422181.1 Uncharacterised protein [Serratia ficaria]